MLNMKSIGSQILNSNIASTAIDRHGAMQKQRELSAFLQILEAHNKRTPIRNVLEIGGMHGGTLWAWSHYASGEFICVDNFVLEGRLKKVDVPIRHIKADSTLHHTRQLVETVLDIVSPDNKKFDLIFIDGDHRYKSVWADAKNWLPLLSETGIAAFHDICHRWLPDHDMWRFWQELTNGYSHHNDIYDPVESWGGIGVITGNCAMAFEAIMDEIPQFVYPNPWPLVMPHQCEPLNCDKCRERLKLGEDTRCTKCATNQ